MKGAPRSKEFDDVYFSAEDGLAETTHVFLDGNDLPGAWAQRDEFTIAETGFGTGLNFLAAWDLFERTARPDQCLEFVSFELYPLKREEIERYLAPWGDFFKTILPVFLEKYPDDLNGVHTLDLNDRVRLTLHFGDVNEALPKLECQVDAWFLDGFKPSSNPEMWSDTVFENMARTSAPGATFATFTAAGFVRRGLQAAGFHVRKVPGFASKREMIRGSLAPAAE
ncbi:MAG: tRNA (5-methylaminomethyl-2-thiouridine)(34)-methyltransferase MnmD [Alphaproteobacteria bacterium]|nr:tRNA (5-methylaminomethyl-2-thiouridine)(34)-methyltransferase MnmD [Alphaproteobacteria bacterium]